MVVANRVIGMSDRFQRRLSSQGGRAMAGTSRVNREVYARFCERLEVKFLRPTRRNTNRQKRRLWPGRWRRSLGRPGFQAGAPVAQRARLQPLLLTVQPQRQAAALPTRDVIPPELLPILATSAVGHQNLQ